MNLVIWPGPVQRDVCEQPVLRVWIAVEPQAKLLPDPAVRAVAPDYVVRRDSAPLAGAVHQARDHASALAAEAGQLQARFNGAAKLRDAHTQQPFGLVLRDIEHASEPGAIEGQVEAHPASAVDVEGEVPDALAGIDEPIGEPHHVENLERTPVNHEGTRFEREAVAL